MKTKIPNKPKKNIILTILPYLSILISLIGLILTFLVRKDTLEMSKFTEKPLFYTIKIYPENYEQGAEVNDKYISMHLKLVVDDFKLQNKSILNLNYNAIITNIKYFMVYDYSLKDQHYSYMRYSLDDKSQAKFTYDDKFYVAPVKLNYSLTPNKQFCYILIYTEANNKKNLDLVFFKYYDKGDTFSLDTITENDTTLIDTMIIDRDTIICKDYFVNLWSEKDSVLKEDIEFMFNVYNDLFNQLSVEL